MCFVRAIRAIEPSNHRLVRVSWRRLSDASSLPLGKMWIIIIISVGRATCIAAAAAAKATMVGRCIFAAAETQPTAFSIMQRGA